MKVRKDFEFQTTNATIRVLDNGREFYHMGDDGLSVSETLYLCRDLSGDEEIYWTSDQIELYVSADEEAQKSGYYDDEHYRSEQQAAYSDGQL